MNEDEGEDKPYKKEKSNGKLLPFSWGKDAVNRQKSDMSRWEKMAREAEKKLRQDILPDDIKSAIVQHRQALVD